jgi:hypothetical protein
MTQLLDELKQVYAAKAAALGLNPALTAQILKRLEQEGIDTWPGNHGQLVGRPLYLNDDPIHVNGNLADYCIEDNSNFIAIQLEINTNRCENEGKCDVGGCRPNKIALIHPIENELANRKLKDPAATAVTDKITVTIEKGQMYSLTSELAITKVTSRCLLINYLFRRENFENFVKESCEDCFTLYFSKVQVAIIDKCSELDNLKEDLNAIIRLAQSNYTPSSGFYLDYFTQFVQEEKF